MIVKIKSKNCKYTLMTIVASVIPEWVDKWLKKCTCPSCEKIAWAKKGGYNARQTD